MKILVTGGTGVISSGIVEAAVLYGYDTYAVTRGNKKYRNVSGAKYLEADLQDIDGSRKVLEKESFDIVVECIAYSVDDIKKSLAIFDDKCRLYVFISSTAVFLKKEGISYIEESAEYGDSEWWYTKQKIECEKYLKGLGRDYIIIRPGVTFSKYRIPFPVATRNPSWTYINRIKNNKLLISCDNVKRSIMYISDFSRITLSIIVSGKNYNQEFNVVSSENEIYWDEVPAKIAAKINKETPYIVHVPLYIFKIYNPEIYDELYYDKSRTIVIDENKAWAGYEENIIELTDRINQIVDESEREYIDNDLHLDEKFDAKCDEIISCMYLTQHMSLNDEEHIKNYLLTNNKWQEEVLENTREKIRNIIDGSESVYIWGCGQTALNLTEMISDMNILAFIDSNCYINIFESNDKKYKVLHDITDMDIGESTIVVASIYFDEIACTLNKYHRVIYRDYLDYRLLEAAYQSRLRGK